MPVSQSVTAMAIPVLIDADVGVDDAVAICLATASAALEVTAVVGVGGSVPLESVIAAAKLVKGPVVRTFSEPSAASAACA